MPQDILALVIATAVLVTLVSLSFRHDSVLSR